MKPDIRQLSSQDRPGTISNENRQFHEKAQTEPNRGPVIGEVQKNVSETVRVEVLDYQGKPFIDVRVFREGGNPTHKGVTIRPEVCAELIPILSAAVEAAGLRIGHSCPGTTKNSVLQPQTGGGQGVGQGEGEA